MAKKYFEYHVKFMQPVDCFGEDITESSIIAENEDKMVEIIKNNYYVEPNLFYIKNKREVELFNPVNKTIQVTKEQTELLVDQVTSELELEGLNE